MSADLRGFEYAAAPLLARRHWELDALVAELGRLVGRIAAARLGAAALCDELEAGAEASSRPRSAAIDPAAQARSLQWLARLQGRLASARHVLDALDAERDALLRRVAARQAGLEALEADRAEALREFALSEAGRAATEADRDWSARGTRRVASPIDTQESAA